MMEEQNAKKSKILKKLKTHFNYIHSEKNIKTKKGLIKHKSHLNLKNRPNLSKIKYKLIDKDELKNILDQIDNDNFIVNEDNIITNVKIDEAGINPIDFSRIQKQQKRNKNKLNKDYMSHRGSGNTLELNCNKLFHHQNCNNNYTDRNAILKINNNDLKKYSIPRGVAGGGVYP